MNRYDSNERNNDVQVDCLRVSVTDRCNLRCVYCNPGEGTPARCRDAFLRIDEIVTLVRFFRDHCGLKTVRLTGGDPLMRADLVDLVERLAALQINDLALTTNGQRLAELAAPLRRAGLHRVNVSLDSLHPDRYRRLTDGGRLERTLAGIDEARRVGLEPIRINTVVIRGENDGEAGRLVQFAADVGLEIRFLELMAMGIGSRQHARWFVDSGELIEKLKERFNLAEEVGTNHRVRRFAADDGKGRQLTVGFISPESRPFCSGCRRLRLTADGRLLSCLMAAGGIDLRSMLEADRAGMDARLRGAVRSSLSRKPKRRARSSTHAMVAIGG